MALDEQGEGLSDTLSGEVSDSEIYRHPLVQSLLDALPQPLVRIPWSLSFPISKQMQDEDKIIIAGYASVEVIDSQGELIPLPVLKEAWEKFKANKYFATGSLMHTNIPVIRILDEYKDLKGQVWKSGVDDTGLFIVAEVRNDIEKGKQTIELIKIGQLTGFSIAGEALASSTVCEGKCYTRIDKMELHEIAVVDRPANQPSVFTIVKSEGLRKLEELTSLLPNLIISPGVAKIAGSIAEKGEGHDFDVLISATKGSFVDRAIQTRIFNEFRKVGKEDLWRDVHIIHEPEGLGPFTDHLNLYDLVLLRSPQERKKMIIPDEELKVLACSSEEKGSEFICPISVSINKLDKAIGMIQKRNIEKLTREEIEKELTDLFAERKRLMNTLYPEVKIVQGEKDRISQRLEMIDVEVRAYQDALGDAIIGKSIKKLDAALSTLRLNGKLVNV